MLIHSLGIPFFFYEFIANNMTQRNAPYRFAVPTTVFLALGRDARPTLTAPQSWVWGWLVPVGMINRFVQEVCVVVVCFTKLRR